jgi:uncharacterized integral membrane protein (TIGR00697 family)
MLRDANILIQNNKIKPIYQGNVLLGYPQLIDYKYLIIFSMLNMSIMLCNVIFTNRLISVGAYFVLGGTFTSPIFFLLSDIIAEIFGYKIARQVILIGFICQTLFTILCQLIIRAPYPDFWKDQSTYSLIFGPLLWINISSFLAFIISSFINVKIITRWKVLLQGRYFWLRSLGASTISEAFYSLIAIIMMEAGTLPLSNVFNVIILSYLIKVSYAIIFGGPANMLVNYIKRTTKIDVYDDPKIHYLFKQPDTQPSYK